MERPLVCVLCTAPVPMLVDRHGLLAHCANCSGVADKYVELETTIIVMDVLLMKPEAFRHWVYNSRNEGGLRLAILTTLFHVYISWAYHEKDFVSNPDNCSLLVSLALKGNFPYVYFLSKSVLELGLFCFTLSYFVSSSLNFLPPQNPLNENLLGSDHAFIKELDAIYEESTSNLFIRSRSPSRSPSRPSLYASKSNLSVQLPQVPFADLNLSLDVVTRQRIQHNTNNQYFQETFYIICNTVLVSGIIKLFPIVMLIWPYDAPVLLATRTAVNLLYIFLLIEVVNIIIPNKNAMFSYKTIFAWLKMKHSPSIASPQMRSRSKIHMLSSDYPQQQPNRLSRLQSTNTHMTSLRQRYQGSHSQISLLLSPTTPTMATTSPGKSIGSDDDNLTLDFKHSSEIKPPSLYLYQEDSPPKQDQPLIEPPESPMPHIQQHPYWKVVFIILLTYFVEMAITHITVIWVASAAWNVTVRDVLVDDWRMFQLIVTRINEVWSYVSVLIL